MCNIVVMCVYWSIINQGEMRSNSEDPVFGPGRCFHLKMVHSIPGIACFINAYITKCLLKPSFYKIITLFCFSYAIFIYVFWAITGRIQYYFLDFSKSVPGAFLNILIINALATLLYGALSHLDQELKPDLKQCLDNFNTTKQ